MAEAMAPFVTKILFAIITMIHVKVTLTNGAIAPAIAIST